MSQIVTMPQLGETVTEGTILRWLVQIGDEVKEDDPILEISTDKVDTEVPSPFTGQVTSLLVEEGETVEVGASLLELDGDSSSSSASEEISNEVETVSEPVEEVVDVKVEEVKSTPVAKSTNLKLSPVVRKLASENNVNLEDVTGTGSDGRITRKDIVSFIASGSKTVQKPKEVPVQHKEKQVKAGKPSSDKISRLRS